MKQDFDLDPMRVIPTSRLVELLAAENKLMALEDAGVRAWDGYLYALARYISIDGYSEGIWSLFPEEVLEDVENLGPVFPIAYMMDDEEEDY